MAFNEISLSLYWIPPNQAHIRSNSWNVRNDLRSIYYGVENESDQFEWIATCNQVTIALMFYQQVKTSLIMKWTMVVIIQIMTNVSFKLYRVYIEYINVFCVYVYWLVRILYWCNVLVVMN